MKRLAKIFTISLMILLGLFLFSCQEAETELRMPEYDETGKYIGFDDIPADYTVDDAIKDGCLVLDTVDAGVNEHGVKLTETPTKVGYEKFTAFCESAERGEDAFLRVAHFIRGNAYYHDLYYHEGKYTIFDCSYELGVSEGESYSLLRRLDGKINGKTHSYYVLTDSMELTYQDVSKVIWSSTLLTGDEIPFYRLMFMSYFSEP